MATGNPITLRHGALELVIAPAQGGSILSFDYVQGGRRWSILRRSDGATGVLEAGSFPLVPFCNRVRGGHFRFRGRDVRLTAKMDGDPHPLHGQGWLEPWEVEEAADSEASLLLRHTPGEWPWAYEARQHFALDDAGLSLSLSCENLSAKAMPCGLGQHPYFHCSPQTRLETKVSYAWTVDEDVLPVDKVPAAGRYDLADRLIAGQALDNGFADWGGIARITDPALPFAIELSSPDADYFQVYSPASGGIFAAEPVSHANAALNEPEERWPDLGLKVLKPGETMTFRARIAISPAGGSGSPAS